MSLHSELSNLLYKYVTSNHLNICTFQKISISKPLKYHRTLVGWANICVVCPRIIAWHLSYDKETLSGCSRSWSAFKKMRVHRCNSRCFGNTQLLLLVAPVAWLSAAVHILFSGKVKSSVKPDLTDHQNFFLGLIMIKWPEVAAAAVMTR